MKPTPIIPMDDQSACRADLENIRQDRDRLLAALHKLLACHDYGKSATAQEWNAAALTAQIAIEKSKL